MALHRTREGRSRILSIPVSGPSKLFEGCPTDRPNPSRLPKISPPSSAFQSNCEQRPHRLREEKALGVDNAPTQTHAARRGAKRSKGTCGRRNSSVNTPRARGAPSATHRRAAAPRGLGTAAPPAAIITAADPRRVCRRPPPLQYDTGGEGTSCQGEGGEPTWTAAPRPALSAPPPQPSQAMTKRSWSQPGRPTGGGWSP